MKSKTEKVFERYSYLADYYANKIWNESNLGLEKEDIAQELKIRLFTAIKRYAIKWKEFRETGNQKPIPLEFYIKTTMVNKCRDFIKEINKVQYDKISETGYDRGIQREELFFEKDDLKIGSQKLSELFEGKEKETFINLVRLDFNFKELDKTDKDKQCTKNVKRKLRTFLINNNSFYKEFEVYEIQ